MHHQPIPLWEAEVPGDEPAFGQPEPSITPYLVEQDTPGAAVIVFPGGGYRANAPHEGEPIARWLNGIGLSAFVLQYRVAPYRHPVPLLDARRAIQSVRANADGWRIDPQRIGVLGFSAGGHLAATLATQIEPIAEPLADAISEQDTRPNALILCYPVISFVSQPHIGSLQNLFGDMPDEQLITAFSAEQRVISATPPTFLWHTAADASVPVAHSLLFAQALAAQGVPFELHIFPNGRHGLGLAQDDPHVAAWTGLCARWFGSVGFMGSAAAP